MIQPEKLFSNFLDDKNITSQRLANFAASTIARFTHADDPEGNYKNTINAISAAYEPFSEILSEIDTAVVTRKGITQTVNEVMVAFGNFMSEYESEIAHALGGFKSPSYTSFYPHGVSEYSHTTKMQMPLLVKRINSLATTHAAELGNTLTPQLQDFVAQWKAALTEQTDVKSAVSEGRADIGPTRQKLELALVKAVRWVAYLFVEEPAKALGFFDFSLLNPVAHPSHPIVKLPVSEN